MSNTGVRHRVLSVDDKSAESLYQLRWLGHVLRTVDQRLSWCEMMGCSRVGWKKASGGQIKIWHQSMNSLITELGQVGRCRLTVGDFGDIAKNRSQWLRCIHFLSSLRPLISSSLCFFLKIQCFLLKHIVYVIFFTTTDSVDTPMTEEFILIIFSHCSDMSWKPRTIYIWVRSYVTYNWHDLFPR